MIAALLLWRGRVARAEIIGAAGVLLVLLGALAPRALEWPSAIWWRFARVLGYVNARILLTVLFGLVVTPLAAVWKVTGKDPLERRRDTWRGWSPYPPRYRDHRHYSRLF